MKILHGYADEGIESEVLSNYGRVIRVGLDPKDNAYTYDTVAIDLLEFDPTISFDLGLFHPPCYKWTQRDSEDAPDLISETREWANKHCEEWIIENKPDAPLHNPVILKGEMFGLPVAYERAFETSYLVEQPSYRNSHSYRHRVENTRPKAYWGAVKGYSHEGFDGQMLATNCVPRPYLEWLLQPLLHKDAEPDTKQTTL